MSRARLISEAELPPENTGSPPNTAQQAALQMLLLALKALSQRFTIALANLFTLVTAASAFWLWFSVLENVNEKQIVAATIYSAFVLALNRWGRK